MRESDIIRLADVLAHLTDRDAIITVLRLGEDLDGQTLQRLADSALRERDKAWAERDEARARIAELEAEVARLLGFLGAAETVERPHVESDQSAAGTAAAQPAGGSDD